MARNVPKPATTFKSAENVSDSDSSASSSASSSSHKRKLNGNEARVSSKKPKLNPAPDFTGSESSEEGSDESSGTDDEDKPNSLGKDTVGRNQRRSGSSSNENDSDESSSSESSDSESDSDVEGDSQVNGTSQSEPSTPSRNANGVLPSASPARLPYIPPPGFSKVMTAPKTPQHASIFEAASLQGKELWYITAPATVPIAELQHISSEQIKSGTTVVTHNSTKYRLDVAKNPDKVRVLVPSKQGEYGQVKSDVTQCLNLSQILSIPDSALFPLDRQPEDEQEVNVHSVRPAREQPQGLRTRWWPTGFEDEEVLAQGAAAVTEKVKKKRSKHHAEKRIDNEVETNGNGVAAEHKKKKSSNKHRDADDDNTSHHKEKGEKRPKEEKKRRKKHRKEDADVDMAD